MDQCLEPECAMALCLLASHRGEGGDSATRTPPADPWRRSGRRRLTSTSAIVPSRSAWSAVSIFIASIDRSTSPALTAWPAATASVETTPGIGAPTCASLPASALRRALRRRRAMRAVRHLDAARLAVELEEHRDHALLVDLADRQAADDQRLALLDVDEDLVLGLHAVEIDRRRQHADRPVDLLRGGEVRKHLRIHQPRGELVFARACGRASPRSPCGSPRGRRPSAASRAAP